MSGHLVHHEVRVPVMGQCATKQADNGPPRGYLVRRSSDRMGRVPPPTPGFVRVYARHSVNRLRAGRWQDVRSDHAQLDGWLAAGLVSATGPHGEDAPTDIPPGRCCGDR